jgi:hypothetical protein
MARNNFGGRIVRPPAPERPAVGVGAKVGAVTRGAVPHSADPRDWRSRGVSEVPGLGQQPTNQKSSSWEQKSPEARRAEVERMRAEADASTPKPW